MDFTGPPCQNFSSMGSGDGIEGCHNKVWLAYFKFHRFWNTPLLIIENVWGCPLEFVRTNLQDKYVIYPVFVDPGDVGFHLIARRRVYFVCYHRLRTVVRDNVVDLYQHICNSYMTVLPRLGPQDALLAPWQEVQQEQRRQCRRIGISYQPGRRTAAYALIQSHQDRLLIYDQKWQARCPGTPPNTVPWLVYALGDNPEMRCIWSAASCRVPTMRCNTQMLWNTWAGRWYTQNERLAMMGWPVYPQLARASGLPLLRMDNDEGQWMLGNSFQLPCAMSVLGCSLACYTVKPDDE